MAQRPDLDLSEIIPAYRNWLGDHESTAGINFVKSTVREEETYEETSLGWGRTYAHLQEGYAVRPSAPSDDDLDAYRVGNGPAECSTSRDLVLDRPVFAWDVNGYYRLLGIPFPYVNATSGVLSRSYVASGGQEDPRATYYLKQLLHKGIRAEYDAMLLGEEYLNDTYVQDAIKARAAVEASRRTAAGVYTKADDVLDDWGLKIIPDGDTPGVDSAPVPRQDELAAEKFDPIEWVYSYWTWRAPVLVDLARLERWQAFLVSALSEAGHRVALTVGVMGHQPQNYAIGHHDQRWIVYLNSKVEPTREMAVNAAAALISDINSARVSPPVIAQSL